MIRFWKNCINYTYDIKEIRNVERGYIVFYNNQADKSIFTLFEHHKIKCVSAENAPFEIVVYDCKNNKTLVFKDIVRLEPVDGYWEIEKIRKIRKEKLVHIEQVIHTEPVIHIEQVNVILLAVREQDKSKERN